MEFGNISWATPSAVTEHITHSWDRDNSQHIEHSNYIQCSKHIQCNTHIQHSKLGSHCQQLQRHHGVCLRTVCSTHIAGTPVGNTGKIQRHRKYPCNVTIWPAETQQVSVSLLSQLMQVSLTIKRGGV